MEITGSAPAEYERFALRRLFWQEMGMRYDDMSHREIEEALIFRALEQKHPQRAQRAQRVRGRQGADN